MILLLVLLATVLGAQEGLTVRQVLFLPPEFYVGDPVEIRALVDHPNPQALIPPSELPQTEAFEVRKVDVIFEEGRLWVVIRFVSFAPGTHPFPVIPLGGGTLRGLMVSTRSALREEAGLLPLQEPISLSGSGLRVGLLLFVVLLLPWLVFRLLGLVLMLSRLWIEQRSTMRPYWSFQQELQRLRREAYRLNTPSFYEQLGGAIRRWLTAVARNPSLMSLTAEEWKHQAPDLISTESMVWPDLLQRCERWVYGGGENVSEARYADLNRAEWALGRALAALKEKKTGARD